MGLYPMPRQGTSFPALSPLRGGFKTPNRTMRFAHHQTVDKKLFSPQKGEKIALSANESIAEFLHFAIQTKFAYAYLNCRVPAGGIQCDKHRREYLREYVSLPSRQSRATPPYNSMSKRAC